MFSMYFRVVNETKVYNMLGFCRSTFHLARHLSFCIILASFTPGQQHLNPVFNTLMSVVVVFKGKYHNYLTIYGLKNVILHARTQVTQIDPQWLFLSWGLTNSCDLRLVLWEGVTFLNHWWAALSVVYTERTFNSFIIMHFLNVLCNYFAASHQETWCC